MHSSIRLLPLVLTIGLAACGGGGGGGETSTSQPPANAQVLITAENATPLSGHALGNVQSVTATGATGGLSTGVVVESAAATGSNFQLAVVEAVKTLVLSSRIQSALPLAVDLSETVSCPGGGSLKLTGSSANGVDLRAGDSFSLVAAGCQIGSPGAALAMTGALSMSVVSGVLDDGLPLQAVLAVSMTELTLTQPRLSTVGNGRFQLNWSASSPTVQTLALTSSVFSTRYVIAGSSSTSTWRDFSQTLRLNGTRISSSLDATIETDSTRLGASGGSYKISTPTPVAWDAVVGDATVTAGVVKLVGGNNSQLTFSFGANNAVTLLVDANGDGITDTTLATTVSALKSGAL